MGITMKWSPPLPLILHNTCLCTYQSELALLAKLLKKRVDIHPALPKHLCHAFITI